MRREFERTTADCGGQGSEEEKFEVELVRRITCSAAELSRGLESVDERMEHEPCSHRRVD